MAEAFAGVLRRPRFVDHGRSNGRRDRVAPNKYPRIPRAHQILRAGYVLLTAEAIGYRSFARVLGR